jgi:SnoaL-like domain
VTQNAFDFAAFRAAFESRNAIQWSEFYADDAEWLEYRHSDPPSRPNVMRGKAAISDFISRVANSPVSISIDDWLIDGDRMAFRFWVELSDGRKIVEQTFIYTANGRITRQIDVEAWD